jgi:hypothetical protein
MSCGHDLSPVDGQCPACLLELAAANAPELAAGTMVAGRFRIVAPLGRGGMGEVYRADDLKLGQPVALKFVPASEETLREVRAGREIAHPNVCRLYDIVDVDDHCAIVMEYVDGAELSADAATNALGIARDICSGLAAIHDRGLAHGDLKPSNIMIDGRGRARITDLGLAHRAGEAARFGGTPGYMAPEQFETRAATPHSDVFALGVILSGFLGAARLPVIARCLRGDPAERPSAREVLEAIEAMETPSPEYVAASEQAARLTSRQSWAFTALALALLALLVALYPRPDALGVDVLLQRARSLAAIYPADEAWWFDDALVFHYRSSQAPMVASRGEVTDNDPPFDAPGMRRVTLTARGAPIAMQSAPQLEARQPASVPQIFYIVLLASTLIAGAVLAMRNLRAGRVDRAGAMRVAVWVFACDAVSNVLEAHHPLSFDGEATVLTTVAAAAALLGAEVWLAYAALEPYARRAWPEALVSWERLLRRRAGDPLVTRDLLLGVTAGLATRLLDLPRGSRLFGDALLSMRVAFGAAAHSMARGVFYALFALFLLVLLRMALRQPAIAALVWLVVITAAWTRWDAPQLDLPLVAAQMLIILIVLQRLGLLAATVAIFTHLLALFIPLNVLPQAAIALALMLAMIACNKTREILH